MSYNNATIINDCITDLQTIDDLNNNIHQLKQFLANSKLLVKDKKELQSIINMLVMKNTKQKDTVHKTRNALNKCIY